MIKKLNDVFEFIRNGASIKQTDGAGGYPITRIETIANSYIDKSRMGYADVTELGKYGGYVLQHGDILMSHINSEKHLGKSAVYLDDKEVVIHGMNLLGMRSKKCLLNSKYANYYFNSNFFRRQLPRITKKSVNQASFSVTDLKQLEILVPQLPIQEKIVEIFDKAQQLIDSRKEQIQACDELIKSQFIEMFGDPFLNPKGYDKVRLGDLAIKVTDGVHAKPEYTTEGRPFISVVNITKRFVDFNNCKYVSEEAYQKMIRSTHPEKGDILYTKVGATYGIPAYVDTDVEFCLYVSVCLIKPKHELINSKFLALSMDMPYIKMQADRRIKGIGVPDLHLNQIREFMILCPPREEQEKFINFVQKVDKLKFEMQQSLIELENNFNSLIQRAFKGELF